MPQRVALPKSRRDMTRPLSTIVLHALVAREFLTLAMLRRRWYASRHVWLTCLSMFIVSSSTMSISRTYGFGRKASVSTCTTIGRWSRLVAVVIAMTSVLLQLRVSLFSVIHSFTSLITQERLSVSRSGRSRDTSTYSWVSSAYI